MTQDSSMRAAVGAMEFALEGHRLDEKVLARPGKWSYSDEKLRAALSLLRAALQTQEPSNKLSDQQVRELMQVAHKWAGPDENDSRSDELEMALRAVRVAALEEGEPARRMQAPDALSRMAAQLDDGEGHTLDELLQGAGITGRQFSDDDRAHLATIVRWARPTAEPTVWQFSLDDGKTWCECGEQHAANAVKHGFISRALYTRPIAAETEAEQSRIVQCKQCLGIMSEGTGCAAEGCPIAADTHGNGAVLAVARAIHAELDLGELVRPMSSLADRLSDALESVAADTQGDAKDAATEPCWLVEKRRDGRTVGFLGHRGGSYEWMPTADQATRFVRREDANGVAECIETEDVIVAEHIWG